MKTLVVMNEKGGVGKTNIVAHAGWFFAERYRTLVIDLDQQANLSSTLARYLSTTKSVELFASEIKVASAAAIEKIAGSLTVARSTRDLLGVEGVDRTCIEVFRDNIASMTDDYDICVIDTPPALTNRTFAALLAADAVLAPIGINDYSITGIAELLRAIRGVSAYYKRSEPLFLGLLPSIYDRKSVRERRMFVELTSQAGKLLFPGLVAKRDSYARAASDGEPVWNIKTSGGREAGDEIRSIFGTVEERMELGQ